jgi:hypothetical protein
VFRGIAMGAWGLVAGLCLSGCGGAAAEKGGAATEKGGAESAAADESKPVSDRTAGHDMDVEMQMDENEAAAAPAERGAEPPPTRTYSPANKLSDQPKP